MLWTVPIKPWKQNDNKTTMHWTNGHSIGGSCVKTRNAFEHLSLAFSTARFAATRLEGLLTLQGPVAKRHIYLINWLNCFQNQTLLLRTSLKAIASPLRTLWPSAASLAAAITAARVTFCHSATSCISTGPTHRKVSRFLRVSIKAVSEQI